MLRNLGRMLERGKYWLFLILILILTGYLLRTGTRTQDLLVSFIADSTNFDPADSVFLLL